MTADEKTKLHAFVRLIERSPDIGDGWRDVGEKLRKFVCNTVAEHPELYEVDDGDMLRIRLSETGRTVAPYL